MAEHAKAPRVVVLVDTSTGWGRGLVRGVARYSRQRGWHLWVEPHGQGERLRPPLNWSGEGLIARVSTAAMARQLASYKVPIVNVSGIELAGVKLPRVTSDLNASGRMAADYFLDKGFRHFAYCGWLNVAHVQRHYGAFKEALAAHGFACPSHAIGSRGSSARGWKRQQSDLSKWISGLPKPVALLTWAQQGLAVLDACSWAGVPVPEEVAVLSGDDDDLLYETTVPPLSGISVPFEQFGAEAAGMLDRLMTGGKAPAQPVLIKPTHVVTRQSSDVLAVEDPDLAAAIRFIREHATEAIQVEDILRHVPVARRSLERKFNDVLGRSPANEIRRVRLQHATRLLAETSLPIPKVAAASGFGSPMYLAHVIKAHTGMTPLKYRNKMRAV
jgi:LacI family transcriptional regulator